MKSYELIKYLFLSAILGIVIQGSGQEKTFGLKAGLNLADLSEVASDKQDMKMGLHAGFVAQIPLVDRWAIQSEILYSRKGAVIDFNQEFLGFNIAKGETILSFDYIDIPVYFAYHPGRVVQVHAGPYVGLLLDAKVDTEVEILNILNLDPDEDIDTDYFQGTEFGLSGGVALDFNLMRLGVSYSHGMTKLSKDDDVSESLIGDAKNRVFRISLGVMF